MAITRKKSSVTRKVRRDLIGGKRGDGNKRTRPIRRPDPRRIRIGKPDSSLSSVAGLVFFGVFLRSLGVDSQLRELFGNLKSRDAAVYQMESQMRLFIDAFVAGQQRIADLEGLASDPIFVLLAGGVLPSIDTAYRDLDRFDDYSLTVLGGVMSGHGLAPLRRMRSLREVHLDIDTTVAPVFGSDIEGAVPGPNPRYHGRPAYHPILARVAETSSCVNGALRTGDTGFGSDDAPFVDQTIVRVRETIGPKPLLYVRIDAAGDCTAILRTIHARGAFFLVKASVSPDLAGAVMRHRTWRTVDRDADGKPCRQVAEISFRRGCWGSAKDLPVRVIAVRTLDREHGKQLYLWEGLEWSVQVYLTNDLHRDADELAWKYDGRAGIEPLIAEWKGAWGLGKFSCSSFHANAALLLIKLLAHNLLQRYVAEYAPVLRGWRSHWIRRALILVPGRLRRSGRVRTVRMQPRPVLERQLASLRQ